MKRRRWLPMPEKEFALALYLAWGIAGWVLWIIDFT